MNRNDLDEEAMANMLEYSSKRCTCCDVEKHVTDFSKDRNQCRDCRNKKSTRDPVVKKEYNAQYYKDKARERNLRHKYGITPEQYSEVLEKQNHCCAICERHEDQFTTRLAVDHNHITMEIRGLLCNNCNRRLVGRHRDGALLRKIADYVDQGTGWFAPKKKRTVKRKPKRT